MMELIIDSKTLTTRFIELAQHYSYISFATAWASSEHRAFQYLLDECVRKIKHSTIGLHFYQTSPDVLVRLKSHKNVKFILQTDGVFHPKVYLFWNRENDWALLSGSANFTNGAFNGKNQEMMTLLKGTDKTFFSEVKTFLTNQCFQQAHHLDDEEIANYQKLHETRARPIRALSNIYTPKEKPQNIEKNILDTSILTYSWKEYFEKIKQDEHHDLIGRLRLLKDVHDVFAAHDDFLDIDIELRKWVAGLPNNTGDHHYAWFGTTKSNGRFAQAIGQDSQEFAKAINQIPLSGEISRNDFLEYIEICKSAGYKNPMGISTRLLTMKRPDLFFCLNSANKPKICNELGISSAQNPSINAEKYWDEILMRIYDTPWFNSPRPKQKEAQQAWLGRVALIDCIYYEPI